MSTLPPVDPPAPPWSLAAYRRAAPGPHAVRARTPATTVRLALGALAAGAVAGIAVPGAPAGLGLALAVVAVAAALAPALRNRLDRHTVGFGVAAVVLAAMVAVRDAEWLVALDLFAAFAVGSTAIAGGRTWTELARGAAAVAVRLPMGPAHLARPMAGATRSLPATARPVLRASAVSAALLVVFGALFASADAAFADLADRLLVPEFGLGLLPARIAVLLVVAALVGAGLLVARAEPVVGVAAGLSAVVDGSLRMIAGAARGTARHRIEWVLPLALLDLLFAAFVAIQFAVFFGGQEHLLSTAGLTAAEHARQGFFQLLAVAAMTLAVVAVAVRRAGDSDRGLLRWLLGALCGLTGVVLLSAAQRLHRYQEAFGFTRLRLVVDVAIIWIAVVLVLVCIAGVLWRAGWLPRAVLASAVIALLALNVVNADAFVARRNVARYVAGGAIDTLYLAELGADAVPELDRLPEPARSCALAEARTRLDRLAEGGWRGANLARDRARGILSARPAGRCPAPGPAR
jgi:hypothetical protein